MTQWFIAFACFAALGALLQAEHAGNSRGRWIYKPAASLFFVLLALSAGALDSSFGVAVLMALLFCFAGDVLLIPSTSAPNRWAFLAGMAAFAIGHGAYGAAFALNGMEFSGPKLAAMGVMAVFTASAIGMMWRQLGDFRWPVVFYGVIISAMVFAAIAAHDVSALADGSTPSRGVVLVAAAVIFAISDIFVARDQFVERSFINRLIGLPLYYGAQLLFAASV